jgi:hypothetical protein
VNRDADFAEQNPANLLGSLVYFWIRGQGLNQPPSGFEGEKLASKTAEVYGLLNFVVPIWSLKIFIVLNIPR